MQKETAYITAASFLLLSGLPGHRLYNSLYFRIR